MDDFDSNLYYLNENKIEGAGIKDKFIQIKESLQTRYYYFMIGVVIATVIIVIVNVIRKVSNKLSKTPENESCTSFKNTTLNILLTIAVLINFYLILPKQIYNYKTYQDKLAELKEHKIERKMKHLSKLQNASQNISQNASQNINSENVNSENASQNISENVNSENASQNISENISENASQNVNSENTNSKPSNHKSFIKSKILPKLSGKLGNKNK